MPDMKISRVKRTGEENYEKIVTSILRDLLKGEKDGSELKKAYLNPLITEVKIDSPPDDFQLNLFMRPSINVVS